MDLIFQNGIHGSTSVGIPVAILRQLLPIYKLVSLTVGNTKGLIRKPVKEAHSRVLSISPVWLHAEI